MAGAAGRGAGGDGDGAGAGFGGGGSASRPGPALHDPYELLQVSPNAGLPVIRAAYRTLARDYHPDVNDTPEAARLMQRLNAAYDLLSDPGRRASYDARRPRPAREAGRGPGSRGSYADRKPRADRRARVERAGHPRSGPRAWQGAPRRLTADIDRPTTSIVTERVIVVVVVAIAVAMVMLVVWVALDDGDDRSPAFRPRVGQSERPATTGMDGPSPAWCASGRQSILPC